MENNYYNPKPIEQLTFTDNGMFQAVLHEPDICAELVERLLHIPVGHVEYPELEKQIKIKITMDYPVIHSKISVWKTVM